MTDTTDGWHSNDVHRRHVLSGVAGTAVGGLAGCTFPTGSSGEASRPVQAVNNAPQTTNPLLVSDSYSYELVRKLYDFGTRTDPRDYSRSPWSFEDWTLEPDNIGTSRPTITATLREDLTFNDGTPLTAEDYAFTVRYIREQQPTGTISASQYDAVEAVSVDSPDGQTVSIFMSEPDNAWFSNVLGSILLPKHIWKNVSDYRQHAPRNDESNGPVGSGSMTLESYSWENWFEFDFRPGEAIPWPSASSVDWIHEDAPFLDGVRIQVFGSENAMAQALFDGEVSCVFEGVSVENAVEAKSSDGLSVMQNPDAGYAHHSFNLRRAPLDDKALRQLLVKLFDGQWVVDSLYEGIGAHAGNYASIAAFDSWRPPDPAAIDGSYRGISVPDLRFPGENGSFQLSEREIHSARQFLLDNEHTSYDFSFEAAVSGVTTAPDGKELYIDGQPLGEVHTDNEGTPDQGPLECLFSPPAESRARAKTAQKWIDQLQQVGIPMVAKPLAYSSLTPRVFQHENFDSFATSWTVGVNQTHLASLYGSSGADLESQNDQSYLFNAMGYTGADELIDADSATLEREQRHGLVKQILATLYADAPTLITEYQQLFEPVDSSYEGFIPTVGGVFESPWLNVRPADE